MPFNAEEYTAYKQSIKTKSGFNPEEFAAYKANPSLWQRFKAGFMEKDIAQPQGFEKGDVAEFAGRHGLETLGGTIMSPFGPAGIGAGAAAGKATHEAIRRGIGAFNPDSTDMSGDLGTVTGKVAGEGLTQAAGAKVLPYATKIVGGTLTGIGKHVVAPILRTTAGVSKVAMDTLIESPSKVLRYIGKSPEEIAAYGKAFQDAIIQNVKRAGELYDSIIKNQVRTAPKYTQDFKSELFEVMNDTIGETRQEFGYGLVNRVADPREAKLFNAVADNIAQRMRRPDAEGLYFLQRDLTNIIQKNEGNPIAAAMGQVKTKLMDYLGRKIPEIGEANSIYRSAKTLEEELRGVINAENPTAMIKNALSKFTTKGDAISGSLSTLERGISKKVATPEVMDIMSKADSIAGARKALEGVVYGSAAKEFAPVLKDLPRTGFAVGASQLLSKPFGMLAVPAFSPRAVGYGVAGAVQGSRAIGRAVNAEASQAVGRYLRPSVISSTEELMRKYYEAQK